MYVNVCGTEGPQNLSNRSSPTARVARTMDKPYAERWTNLFLSVLCFSFRFCVSYPLLVLPLSAFRSLRSRFAQSSLIRAWLSAGRILRRRFCHRNGQLLTENYRLFALEFFIIEHRFYLNFANNKINGTLKDKEHVSKIRDNYQLNYIWIKQYTLPNCFLIIKQKFCNTYKFG